MDFVVSIVIILGFFGVLLSRVIPDKRRWLGVGLMIFATMPCVTWCLFEAADYQSRRHEARELQALLNMSVVKSQELIVVDDRSSKVPGTRYVLEYPAGSGNELVHDHRMYHDPHQFFAPIFVVVGGIVSVLMWCGWRCGCWRIEVRARAIPAA